MKRVLVAVALGGLLLVGTPTLASSAQRNDTRADKNVQADKGDKGEKGDRGGKGDNNRGDSRRGDNNRSDRGDRGDRRDHDDHDGYYGRGYGDYYYGYPYYGGYYGEPYDCYYGRRGAYNCEPYGGDYYPGYGYGYGGGYRSGYPGAAGDTVDVRGRAFNPPEIRVRQGQDVTWVFNDREPHTVTADNKSFDSGKRQDGEFRLSFQQPGTYSYHCAIHPQQMRGRVLVG